MITDIQLHLAIHDKNIRILVWKKNGVERSFLIEDVVEGFEADQQSVQADGDYCQHNDSEFAVYYREAICEGCGKPRR